MGRRGKKCNAGFVAKSSDKIVRQHFAFTCSVEDILDGAIDFLEDRNLEYYNFLGSRSKEPMVFAWMPAISIYLKDPDGHELEFIAKLPGKPMPDLHVLTYNQWIEHSTSNKTRIP